MVCHCNSDLISILLMFYHRFPFECEEVPAATKKEAKLMLENIASLLKRLFLGKKQQKKPRFCIS